MRVNIEATNFGTQKVVISSENVNESTLLRLLMSKTLNSVSGTVTDGNAQSAELWLELK